MCGLRNSKIGITFLTLAMQNVAVLHTGPLLLPQVCPGEVPPGSVVYAAAGIGQRRGGESGHDCSSAGKQAVCAKRSGHRSWKICPNPFAVGLRRLVLWKCSWAIIKAYFSRDAGMLGNFACILMFGVFFQYSDSEEYLSLWAGITPANRLWVQNKSSIPEIYLTDRG